MATPIPANRAALTTWSVLAATGGTAARVHGDGARATGITSDSRAVVPGGAFAALRGENFDGHAFLKSAVDAGATLVLVERGRGAEALERADVIEVDDTLVAWGQLARAHLRAWKREPRGELDRRVVAITGSAGKTTTKDICAALLREVCACHATAGNLNNRIGVPAVAFGVGDEHRVALFEIGMNTRGEIAELSAILEPDVAAITNIGVAHAGGVGGGRADVAREKGALYEALERDGIAVVNADDAAVVGQIARTRAHRVELFGRADAARYRLVDRASRGPLGSRVTVERPAPGFPSALRDRVEVDLNLVGEAAAIDFVAALAAAEAALGKSLSRAQIQHALEGLAPTPGRAAVHRLQDGTLLIDDTYNANPASMRAALSTAAELCAAQGEPRRLVVVLGEMFELGEGAKSQHEALGDDIVGARVALAIGCGGLIDLALDAAARGGTEIIKAKSTDEAVQHALARVRPKDVVLVKGSRSVGTERVVAAIDGAKGGA